MKVFYENNKKKVITCGLVLLLLGGCGGTYAYMHSWDKVNDNIQETSKEKINYLSCVSGLRNWSVEVGITKVDYLDGVKWDKTYISKVTVNDDKVDLTKENTYTITYIIDIKDKDENDIKKEYKVTVLSKDKVKELSEDGKEVVTTNRVENKIKKTVAKTENGNKVTNTETSEGNISKPEEPSKTTHTHSWVEQFKTVHHDAVYEDRYVVDQAAYDEQVPKYETVEVMICNKCGTTMRSASELNAHIGYHAGLGETISWREDWVQELVGYDIIHHDEVGHTERVLVKAAWDEKVSNGYKCSGCGKTK